MKLVNTVFAGLGMECKIWDDSATVLAWLDSLQAINPLNNMKILLAEKVQCGLFLRSFFLFTFCGLLISQIDIYFSVALLMVLGHLLSVSKLTFPRQTKDQKLQQEYLCSFLSVR